jgi:hypothetical protein
MAPMPSSRASTTRAVASRAPLAAAAAPVATSRQPPFLAGVLSDFDHNAAASAGISRLDASTLYAAAALNSSQMCVTAPFHNHALGTAACMSREDLLLKAIMNNAIARQNQSDMATLQALGTTLASSNTGNVSLADRDNNLALQSLLMRANNSMPSMALNDLSHTSAGLSNLSNPLLVAPAYLGQANVSAVAGPQNPFEQLLRLQAAANATNSSYAHQTAALSAADGRAHGSSTANQAVEEMLRRLYQEGNPS